MPRYEYRCPANDRTVEVRHGMSETLETWGALLERAGLPSDGTDPRAPVERLLSVPAAVGTRSEAPSPPPRGCGPACACYPES